MEKPKVWTDPDLCSGCGRCGEIAPNIFKLNYMGVSVVHLNGNEVTIDGISGRELDQEEISVAIEAAEECPGEIIFIEF